MGWDVVVLLVPCRRRESEIVGNAAVKDLLDVEDGLEGWVTTEIETGTVDQPAQDVAIAEDTDSEVVRLHSLLYTIVGL